MTHEDRIERARRLLATIEKNIRALKNVVSGTHQHLKLVPDHFLFGAGVEALARGTNAA